MSQVDYARAPHPGKILKEKYMEPRGMSGRMLAKELGIHSPRINDIILQRRGITADTALRLASLFKTTPKYWLHLQVDYDLSEATNKH